MTQFLANPITWGAVAALLGLLLIARNWWFRPQKGSQNRRVAKDLPQPTRDMSDYWEAPLSCAGDRRHKLRREGNPLPVHYRLADGSPLQQAFVMDRSFGGLRLAVKDVIAPGTFIFLLADQAPAGTPWAEAKVSWCKPVLDRHELGCQFVADVPWNVLLLFG